MMRPKKKLEAVQRRIAASVVLNGPEDRITTVAGCDAAYLHEMGAGACALLSYPGLELLEVAQEVRPVQFSYMPGYFAFREVPLLLEALRKLSKKPDCLLVDGHGIAHPRGAGIASHVGVLARIPTIGCAKNPLIGEYGEPGDEKGSVAPLFSGRKMLGYAVRSRSGVKPIYVSPGHLIDHSTAVEIVMGCCHAYRIPEPLRVAHMESCRLLEGEA